MSHLVKKSGHNFSLACDHAASLRLLAGLPFSCFVFLCHHAFMFRANQPLRGTPPYTYFSSSSSTHRRRRFQDTFCCHTCAQPAPYIFFSSHALGLDPQYATFRHYPSPLVIPFMDGSDSLVCYLILTSHVHFFYAIPPGETEARPFTSGTLTLRLSLP